MPQECGCLSETIINKTYREMAQHYGTAVIPARVKARKDKSTVEAEMKNVKDVLAKPEATKEEIETATKTLSEKLQAVGQAMYQQNSKTEDGGQKTEGNEEPKTNDENKKAEEEPNESDTTKNHVEEGQVVE